MGQKWPCHRKKIQFVGQMFLDKMQQMRREKKYHQSTTTECQGQIANGFSQFNYEGNNFCVCRHGKIQVYR